MSLAVFIETKFIPNHVYSKSIAGRTHYQAMLKHVLKPETVDRLFTSLGGKPKARLKAVPDWPYLDNVRLCDVRPDHVRRLTSSAAGRGYSPQTVKHIRSVMSAVISHAKRERVFSGDNPISEVELPRMARREPHDLTIIQAKAILRLMRYPEREIALIMITTGMGISEICALQWKHLNLSAATVFTEGEFIPPRSIAVKKQLNASGVVDVIGSRARKILLPEPLIHSLTTLRQTQKITDPNWFVVGTRDGRPTNVRMLQLKPIGQQLKMPWLSWQALKRAHEILLLELRVQLTDDLVLSTQ